MLRQWTKSSRSGTGNGLDSPAQTADSNSSGYPVWAADKTLRGAPTSWLSARAARIRAAGQVSGSFLVCPDLGLFECVPRGRHLRATPWVVMVSLPLCKKFSERFLQMWEFSSSLRRGLSYVVWSRLQEKKVFSCS